MPHAAPASRASWTRFDAAMLGACALLPAALAAAGAASAAPAAHDEGVVRAVGLGWTGLLRGLDVMLAAPMMLMPFGTRALRAGLASALVTGACGAVAFVLARALVTVVRPAASRTLSSAVAAVAVLSALLASIWQAEASAPAGSVVGALLVLAAVAIGSRVAAVAGPGAVAGRVASGAGAGASASASADHGLRGLALVLGLAASYEPLVLAAVVAALAPWLEALARNKRLARADLLDALPAFALGLAPFALAAALARRAPEIAITDARLFASPLGQRALAPTPLLAFGAAEVGALILLAAAAGVVLACLVPPARRWVASLSAVVVVGAVGVALRVPSGPGHAAPVVLAATCAIHVLAAVALAAAVLAIARARVPFAEASAALVVVLELALPVRAADETMSRREARAAHASTVWNELAWGPAPPAAVVLVSEPATMRRVAAARAAGEMRADLVVVPTFALPSRITDRALAKEPKLAPLYRDLRLGSTPEELSLAQLAGQRPVLAGFDPRWDRGLARHFVPVGLTTRFETEPRGVTDRRRALEAFAADKERLVRVAVAKKDAELASATATLLRGRAIGMAACGERDVLSRALDDLRPFAPDDSVASTLVRRIVTSKGPIDVRDLAP